MLRIYLSGPISGIDITEARNNFEDMERRVEVLYQDIPHVVYNPMKLTCYRPDRRWQDYMHVCLAVLAECDTIIMLPGWERSRGAVIEQLFAEGCGIRVLTFSSTLQDITSLLHQNL